MNFTPRDKLSKKAKRELDVSRRKVWNFKPTSRIKPSGKIYSRKGKHYEM